MSFSRSEYQHRAVYVWPVPALRCHRAMDAVIRLTWLGHSTVLVDDCARVLTDPILTDGILHLHRRAGQTPRLQSHDVDAVVISHLHSDHLHLPSLALLPAGTPALLPRGAASLVVGTGVEAVEVSAGETVRVGELSITAVPAHHPEKRWPWGRLRCAALGYLFAGKGVTYFAGDTDIFPGMAQLHPALDAALLPVGGWGPWLRGEHMDPSSAAGALLVLRPAVAVPIHYGTFWPRGLGWLRPSAFHDPGRRFDEHAARTAPEVDVRVLDPGMSTQLRPQ